MALSTKHVKITDFLKKSDTGDDQRSDLDQAIVNPKGRQITQEEYFKNASGEAPPQLLIPVSSLGS